MSAGMVYFNGGVSVHLQKLWPRSQRTRYLLFIKLNNNLIVSGCLHRLLCILQSN